MIMPFLLFTLLATPPATASEPACLQVRLAEDKNPLWLRGWTDGQRDMAEPFEDPFGGPPIPVMKQAVPDIAAFVQDDEIWAKPYIAITVDPRPVKGQRGILGCMSFGDTRAFERAYASAQIMGSTMFMVTVNGKPAFTTPNEEGVRSSMFTTYSHLKTKLQIWYSNVRPVT